MQINAFVRALCRILVVCFAASSISAQAGMIGTDAALQGAAAQAGAARQARETIARQLEALGIAAGTARERVAAISDAEALDIAGRIDSAPAGALAGTTFFVLLIVAFLIWRFGYSEQGKAEQKAREAETRQPKK